MAKSYYLPRTEPGILAWLQNFSSKLSTYATTLGVTAPEVTFTTNFYTAFAYVMAASTTFKTFTQDINVYKLNLLKGAVGGTLGAFPTVPTLGAAPPMTGSGSLTVVTSLIQRMKVHPNYTVAIGEDLGIEGAEQTLDPSTAKPNLKGAFESNNARLKFSSFPVADGVRIESMRGVETVFTFLATDTESPYIDTRAKLDPTKPETRKYRAIFFDNVADNVIGMWSDEVTVTVP